MSILNVVTTKTGGIYLHFLFSIFLFTQFAHVKDSLNEVQFTWESFSVPVLVYVIYKNDLYFNFGSVPSSARR